MATNNEEMVLRLGMDSSGMTRGTQKALDEQKKAAADYTSFWKKAITDRENAEIAADVRAASRANRASQLRRERAQRDAEQLAAINAEIAAGSGGYGSGFGAAGKGGKNAAIRTGIAGTAGAAATSAATGGGFKEIGLFTGGLAFGKIVEKIFEKGLLGINFSKFGRAVSRLVGGIEASATALITGIPIIGAGIAGIMLNLSMRRQLGEMAGGYGTIEGSKGTQKLIADRLLDKINELEKEKNISQQQASAMRGALAAGGLTGIKSVQRDIAKYLPQGFETKIINPEETAKKQKESYEERAQAAMSQLDKMQEKEHTQAEFEKDRIYRQNALINLQNRMKNMDKESIEYAKLQAIQADYLLQIEIDKTKEKEKQNQKDDAQAKLADLKSQKANLHKSDYMPTPDQIRKSRKFGGIQRDIDFLTGQATNALLEGNQDLAEQARAQIEGYDVPVTPWQEAQNKAQEDLNKKMGFHHDIPFKRHVEGLKETLANAGLTPQDMSISNIDRNISDLLKKASIDGIKLSDK